MTNPEIPLTGGHMTSVVRVGDTVRRGTGSWSPAVHAFLRHLEAVGFDGAPRLRGIDHAGREILTYLDGEQEDVMHRKLLVSVVPVVAVVLLALVGLGIHAGAVAQEATPTAGHPLIGTWLADTDLDDPDNPPDAFHFTADGGFVEIDANGDRNLGAWEATGATTANLTIVSAGGDDEGNTFGTLTIRASFEVGADGDSFTAEFTIEFIDPDGTSSGEAGPGHGTGVRLAVEAPGTPVLTLDELFSQFEGEPEATPAS